MNIVRRDAMHDFGKVRAEAGARYTTFLPAVANRGTVRLEIHVQCSLDGKTYYQAMSMTTPDVTVEDGKLDWLVALKPERPSDEGTTP